MVQKRQLAGEDYEVSPKHFKLEHSCELLPSLQFTKDAPLQSDKDEGCFFTPVIGVDYGFVNGKIIDLPVSARKDVYFTLPGRLSTSSWASSTISEEDKSEAPPETPDAYSNLLEHSPVKQVPIGPEYQADIPEWLESDENEIKFMGSFVIPMPEDSTICNDNTIGRGRTDCCCDNPECVKQHIKEAREIMKARIGQKCFAELGLDDMGEVVAEKWTEEDEQLFHEVVYSNPVSLGKNFWHNLAAEFPSRTKQEIVSYYFNVFMLRRRAEQNRRDSINADSDDDEWQGNDKSEEEDEGYKHEYRNCIENNSQPRNSCSFDSMSQPSEKTVVDGDQYDSCTSSDTAGTPCASEVKIDTNKSWGNHEFVFEPLDARVWDVGYFSCSRTKTDFLPTGSMIEEVFGVESWDFEMMDDNKSPN